MAGRRPGAVPGAYHRRMAELVTFDPDADTLDVIRRICDRLDGIPLAVELAAAWVRVLSPDQLLDRLEDRLDVLERTPSPQAPNP